MFHAMHLSITPAFAHPVVWHRWTYCMKYRREVSEMHITTRAHTHSCEAVSGKSCSEVKKAMALFI